MFWFAVKKWVFDFWDNLFSLIMANVITLSLASFALFVPPTLWKLHPILGFLGGFVTFILFSLLVAGINGLAWQISSRAHPRLEAIKATMKRGFVPAMVLGGINVAVLGLGYFALGVYGSMGTLMASLPMGLTLWILVFWLTAQAWTMPLSAQVEPKLGKLLKKTFLLTFDNAAMTLAMGVWTLVIVALSLPGLTLVPGLAGLVLWHQTVLKLRMYKYDWMEQNPQGDPKKIPWKDLLKTDQEQVGKRTLKSIIFPGRD